MKKIIPILAIIIIISTIIFLKKPEVVNKIKEIVTGKVNKTVTTTTILTTTTIPTQTGNETNASAPVAQKPPTQQIQNLSKEIPPEIVNLCLSKPSSAISNESQIITSSRGMIYCINQKPPYYLKMQLNDSNLTTWVDNYPGTEQTFNLSVEKTIYYLFVGDISNLTVENFYMIGNVSEYFSIGDYSTYTTGTAEVAVLPFDVNKDIINVTEDWEEIKLYLKSSLKDYYLGNLFVKIN